MILYECIRCDYYTEKKCNIKDHYKRKRPCKITKKDIDQIECLEFLNSKNISIKSHLKEQVGQEKEKVKELEEKVKELEEQIKNNTNSGMNAINIPPNPTHFIYIIKEREFVKSGEEIYKIGKTRGLRNRMGDYPKGSVIKLVYPCEDIDIIEKELLHLFDEHFIRMVDVGHEYFRGNVNVMANLVTNHITSKTEIFIN
jgi:hypothetical protein